MTKPKDEVALKWADVQPVSISGQLELLVGGKWRYMGRNWHCDDGRHACFASPMSDEFCDSPSRFYLYSENACEELPMWRGKLTRESSDK